MPSFLRLLGIVGTGMYSGRTDREYITWDGRHMQDRRLGLYQTLCLVDSHYCSHNLPEGYNLKLVVAAAEPVAAATGLMAVDTVAVDIDLVAVVAADTDLMDVVADLVAADADLMAVVADPVAADTDLMAVDTERGLWGNFGLDSSLHLVLCRDQSF